LKARQRRDRSFPRLPTARVMLSSRSNKLVQTFCLLSAAFFMSAKVLLLKIESTSDLRIFSAWEYSVPKFKNSEAAVSVNFSRKAERELRDKGACTKSRGRHVAGPLSWKRQQALVIKPDIEELLVLRALLPEVDIELSGQ